ncbi:MAG: uridylate kinase [Methanobacteriota archaeon]
MDRPLVIKIGGSLLPHASEIIQVILREGQNILILPGGGVFADAVRGTDVQGTAAHWMAIAGMEQYGWYLSTFGVKTTDIPFFSTEAQVLLPYQVFRHHDPLPHSWEITSDTISAWLADYLSADLLILKSIDHIRAGEQPLNHITTQIETNDLDPCFIPFILSHAISGEIINGTVPERVAQVLKGIPVTGTHFGTTIKRIKNE